MYVCGSLGLGDCFVCDSGICLRIILQISKKKKCLGKYQVFAVLRVVLNCSTCQFHNTFTGGGEKKAILINQTRDISVIRNKEQFQLKKKGTKKNFWLQLYDNEGLEAVSTTSRPRFTMVYYLRPIVWYFSHQQTVKQPFFI